LIVAASGWFKETITPRDSSGSGIFSQGTIISSYFNWNSEDSDVLGYGDININIDGPSQKSSIPSFINFTQALGLNSTYSSLGVATPGQTLSAVANCASFTCTFSMTISETSTAYLPDYWMMFCSDGYYATPDGNNVYYYEQICGAYKTFNFTVLDSMTYTKTKFDSFYMTANFTKNAVPFLLMSQGYGSPYYRATTATSFTLYNGKYTASGTNLNGDELLDVIAQSRDFSKDGYYITSS